MEINEFFTWTSIGTLGGSSAAVVVLANTCRNLARKDTPWFGFFWALLISGVGAYKAGVINDLSDILMVLINTCLLFSTAAGMQQTAIFSSQPAGGAEQQGRKTVPWFSSWF